MITTSSTIEPIGRFRALASAALARRRLHAGGVAGGNASLGVAGIGGGIGGARRLALACGVPRARCPSALSLAAAHRRSAAASASGSTSRRRCPGRLRPGSCASGCSLGRLCSLPRSARLGDRLLGGHAIGVGRAASRLVQQARLDRLLGAGVAALAHTRALADTVAQVVELRAPHVAARGQLDALDLGRVHREHALDADAEGLLAHRERLARAMTLALDDDALEHLHAAAGALDHLEVDLDAVARREVGDAAQLRALDGFDNAAHDGEGGCAC